MGRLFLADCAPGDVVENVFVITGKQFSASASGKYFIKAFVSDRSAQLAARLWNATRDIFNAMPESGFLKVRIKIENYQNNLQAIVEQMWPAKAGTFEMADLIPHTDKDIPKMCERLTAILRSIRNRHLLAIMNAYLDDKELMDRVCKAPAAMSFHHAFLGGLLEHTLNAMEVANAIAKFYPGLNRDLLIAGIFLHDIAKVWELSYECAFGYTDGGQLVGHIVKSAIWLEHKAKEAEAKLSEKIPQPLVDVLQHIIISHHGQPEFGAVKLPATPEAIAVHYIENLDAKLMISLSATRGDARQGSEGNWSEYLKSLGGRLYRPDTAPPDDGAAAEPPSEADQTPSAKSQVPTMNMSITNPLFGALTKRP